MTNYVVLILHMTVRTWIYSKENGRVQNIFFSKFQADTILPLYSCSVAPNSCKPVEFYVEMIVERLQNRKLALTERGISAITLS